MSSSNSSHGVINWKTVGVATIAGAGAAALTFKILQNTRRHTEMEAIRSELISLQQELASANAQVAAQLSREVAAGDSQDPPLLMQNCGNFPESVRSWTTSSICSNDMYEDANEDWSSAIFFPAGSVPAATSCPPLNEVAMESFDTLLETDCEKAYDQMKKIHSEGGAKDPELLWRMAKACHLIASDLDRKNPKKKAKILEGRDYAQAAAKITESSFLVLKWAAIMTGTSTDYLGTKEKIEQGNVFKSFLDKALAMDAKEFSLLHMRGRYAFSVANLSWLERKAAAAFFAAPPEATIDEALTDFLAANVVRPHWIENLLYIARCYIAKKDYKKAAEFLRETVAVKPDDDSDKELIEEAAALLKKHGN